MAANFQIVLRKTKTFSARYAYLLLHQVDARDEFRYRVFHLQAGIHFQEIEMVVGIQQKLYGSGPDIIATPGHTHCGCSHALAQIGGKDGTGGFFDHFLVSPLYTTVPLEQVHDVAMRIGQHLNLNVPGFADVFFNKNRAVPEGTDGFAHGAVHLLGKFFGAFYDAHAFTAATGSRFDEDRKADLLRGALGFLHVRNGVIDTGHHGYVVVFDGFLGRQLIAHHFDGVRPWSDEDDPGFGHFLGEDRVFAQEPVPRMDRIGSGITAGLNDLVHHQVGLCRRGRSQQYGFVGEAYVRGVAVGLAVHRDGLKAHFAGGAHDAQSDLTPVGY